MTKVSSNFIKLGAITTTLLADLGTTSDKLGPASVITTKIADRNVTTAKIALLGVTAPEIADAALIERHYSDESIPTAAIQLLAVDTEQLADFAVTGPKIATAAVEADHIGDDQVNQNHYADLSIQTPHLADEAVATAKIGSQAVTIPKLQLFTANRIMVSDGSGVLSELPPGSDGQNLITSGSGFAWAAPSLPTGMVVSYFGLSPPSGWVLMNGSTIGNVASEADQASDTYQPLFEFLWNNFNQTLLPVVGGRGISATDDWEADKKITMPDMRGRVPVGVETSETSSGRLDVALLDGGAALTTIGAVGGDDKIALTISDIPAHTHTLMADGLGTNVVPNRSSTNSIYFDGNNSNSASYTMTFSSTYITPTFGKSGPAGNGSSPEHENMQPFMLVNYIMKV